MQKVRFGISLDGQSGWLTKDAAGESTVGPLGMLTMLETQLGLLRVPVPQSERVVQFRGCLQRSSTGSRFYERSFRTDELGTAATLLGWRDHWYEHGWAGRMPADASARLGDMAAVEGLATATVAPGIGQRLADVALMLTTRRPQIEVIELFDPLESFPLAWRRVLALLPTADRSALKPQGTPGSLLRELQESLLDAQAGGQPTQLQWRDDDSITVARGESRIAAAQWLARRITAGDSCHAVVAPLAGSMLDAALSAADRPRLGLAQASSFRPSQQLLPLAMRLIWEPVDFQALLEFLTHAVHPIPVLARRRIAERLAKFFRNRLLDEDDARRAAWHAGHSQACALRQSLQTLIDQGVDSVAREALDKLLAQATAQGTGNPLLQAQAGALASASHPAALIEPFNEVSWWQLGADPLPNHHTHRPTHCHRQLRRRRRSVRAIRHAVSPHGYLIAPGSAIMGFVGLTPRL